MSPAPASSQASQPERRWCSLKLIEEFEERDQKDCRDQRDIKVRKKRKLIPIFYQSTCSHYLHGSKTEKPLREGIFCF
jgi:hypothetical protein